MEAQSHIDKKKLLELQTRRKIAHTSAIERAKDTDAAEQRSEKVGPQDKPMQFSLIFFSADGSTMTDNKYQLLLEAAKFADQHGFTAIWVPERHFTPFGGLYPHPATLAAALAMVTSRVQIRAGSVVLPMHHPISVVEEWSIIDNLSGGRIGISFASGWSPNDFALRPEVYANRKEELFCGIETVHQLWQGETIQMRNGNGDDIHVRAFPKPLQATLPTWITSTSSPDTCTRAGKIGAHLLTALLRLSVEEIAAHIELYRHALSTHGFDPYSRIVTVMLHTYVHETLEIVRERVKKPLISYLRTYLTMFSDLARSILHLNIDQLTEQDKDALAQFAFERYFTSNGLFGTPATCLPMIKSLKMVGVNELACLIDFGLDFDTVMEGLSHLALLKEACTVQNL